MSNPLIKITNIKEILSLVTRLFVLKGIDLEINKGEYVADGTFCSGSLP
jgi:putative ABC transport system ATP-binding protein